MKLLKEKKIFQYIAVFMLILIFYVFFRLISPQNTDGIRYAMLALAAADGIFILYCRKTGKLNAEILTEALVYCGLVMRIGYMLITPCTERIAETPVFDASSTGHAGYLLSLIQNKALQPDSCRPPLFYILGALVSAPLNSIIGTDSPEMLADAAKVISTAASCFILLMAAPLCEEAGINGRFRAAAVGFTAFCPSFLLGETITPDMLAAFFMTLTLLYTLRWFSSPSWKNTAILALSSGLGIITDISAGTLAVFTCAVFLWKCFTDRQSDKDRKIIPEFIVMCIVNISCTIYTNRLKGVPDFFTSQSADLSDHSYFQRFILPDFSAMLASPYAGSSDYTLWSYMLKSSLFGEFTFSIPSFISGALLFAAAVTGFTATAGIICGLFRISDDNSQFITSAACIIFTAWTVSFCIRYPGTHSMDFSRMTFLVIPGAVLAGKFCAERTGKAAGTVYTAAAAVYSLFSCLVYTLFI